MKKNKLLLKILILLSLVIILVSIIFVSLKKNSIDKNIEWSWEKENLVLNSMLENKYLSKKSPFFPIVMMKNQEIPEKGKDEKRILVVGDSYVYGYSDTNLNYTWWKQLNLRIKEAGYSNVNVYAAASYFMNTKDQLEKILKNEELMQRIDPDLIIIGYVYNDPEERDETNMRNLVVDHYEIIVEDNEIYKQDQELYYKLVDEANSLDTSEYERLKEIGDKLGFYRWDVRPVVIAEGERLDRYKNVLREMDDYINELSIPYFYFFLGNIDNPLIDKAYVNVYNAMKELSIDTYYEPFDLFGTMERYNSSNETLVNVNPNNSHPGIVWNYEYSIKTYDILKNNYNFIFEDAILDDINNLDININDTMPFLDVNRKKKNVFEFEYPKKEKEKNEDTTNFLYYPIEKNYVKLNLEYPKEISKIRITGKSLKDLELYVNIIDEKYGFDFDEANKVLTKCKLIGDNVYEVNAKITSINISAQFFNETNRNIKIEFIEE